MLMVFCPFSLRMALNFQACVHAEDGGIEEN